jgi:hypothetical protein
MLLGHHFGLPLLRLRTVPFWVPPPVLTAMTFAS